MRKITPEQANKVYDILVNDAGANDTPKMLERESFIFHVAVNPHPTTEYRFGGNLGWGGKFRNNGNYNNTPYVDYYKEDTTPERDAIVSNVNSLLKMLFQ